MPKAAPLVPGDPPLAPARRRLFIAITLAVPFLLLALLELGLRAGGYGHAYPLFVPVPEHDGWLVPNDEFSRRYFGDGQFAPTPQHDFFRAVKRAGALRLVVQGESSAEGFPYGHGAAPSRIVAERVRATFADREVEVVNTALTAVNSYTLLDQADEIIAQHPDAILIYTGHNEYYGAFGVGSARGLGRSRTIVRAYLALRHLRIAQLLAAASGVVAGRADAGADAPRTVMELMSGEQGVPLGSAQFDRGVAQFRANLDALLARYQARGIPVYIGTIASNERDQPPFVTGYGASVDTAALLRDGQAALTALARGDTATGLRAFEAVVRTDSAAAGVWYLLATLYDVRGDTLPARVAYRRAKEADALRFRAPEAMNAVIRQVAARRGAVLVESQAALERASPLGVVGRTLMLEHLHPNVAGYTVIADAFYDALRAHALGGAWPAPVRAAARVTALDSLTGVYRTDRLTSGWPFQPRGTSRTPIVDTLRPRTPAEQLAQAVVLGRLPWVEATDRLRAAYEKSGDAERAIGASLAMAEEYGYLAQPLLDAARVAAAAGHDSAALAYVRAATAREETPNSVELLGLMLMQQGDADAARPYLERAAQLAPTDRRMTSALAAARALPAIERGRARAPRDTTLLYEAAVSYALTRQFPRAREALAALRALSPDHAGAKALLAQLPP